MIIYNVTIKVDNAVAATWVHWMKTEHMPALTNTGLFYDSRLCRLLEQDETDGATFVAQYFCHTMAQYDAYIAEYSESMRAVSNKLFGGKMAAFRTIMEAL